MISMSSWRTLLHRRSITSNYTVFSQVKRIR